MNFMNYRAKVGQIRLVIGEAMERRNFIMNDNSRKDSWYSEQIGKIKQNAAAEIGELFQELRADLAKDLERSKPKEIGDFNERMYKSQAVAQEIAGIRPDQLTEYFTKMAESNDQIKIQEAYRLIDTKFEYLSGNGTEHSEFRSQAYKVLPEIRNHESIKAAVQSLESVLPMTQHYADLALNDAMNGGVDYSADLAEKAFDGAVTNAEKASQI